MTSPTRSTPGWPLAIAGAALSMAPEAVLASVAPQDAGKASGATKAIREIGAAMGVAVLASVFAANGGYETPQAFTDGMVAALPVTVVILLAGAVLAMLTLGRAQVQAGVKAAEPSPRAPEDGAAEPAPAQQAG